MTVNSSKSGQNCGQNEVKNGQKVTINSSKYSQICGQNEVKMKSKRSQKGVRKESKSSKKVVKKWPKSDQNIGSQTAQWPERGLKEFKKWSRFWSK